MLDAIHTPNKDLQVLRPIQILDGNSVFMTIAQSLASDPKTVDNCYQLDGVRRFMLSYVQRDLRAGKEMVVVADSASWRREVFTPYKHRRQEDKKASTFKYPVFMECMDAVLNEWREFSPATVLRVDGAEGDDLVTALTAVFSADRGVDIHSSDHDLLQLQLHYERVRQFSPGMWKWMTPEMENYSLQSHIIRGDSGDGVPNVLSEDNVFVERIRQTAMTAGRYKDILEVMKKPQEEWDADLLRRYSRNKTLIDLREIPDPLIIKIFAAYERESTRQREPGAWTKYLASHGIL